MNIHEANKNIGRVMAEALGLVEDVKLSSNYKGREVDHTFTDSRSGRKAKITRQARTTKESEFRGTDSKGREISGDRARRYHNKLMSRTTPPKPDTREMANQKARPNTPRSGRSSQTGRNMSNFGLRR